jgi:hypothetical protein
MKIYRYQPYQYMNFGLDLQGSVDFIMNHPKASSFIGKTILSPAYRIYKKVAPVGNAIKEGYNKLWDNKPMQAISRAHYAIKGASDSAREWLDDKVDRAGQWLGDKSMRALKATGRAIGKAGIATGSFLADKAGDAWDATRGARSAVGHWIADKPMQAVHALKGGLKGMWQGFKTTGFPGLITGAIGGAAGGWIGRRKEQRLFRALRDKAGYMTDAQLRAIARQHINPNTLSENWADKLGKPFDVQV